MIRVGIFFGGQSREREVSFAGGRTIYDNLDKSVFEPIAVFVDGLGRFILLDWKNIYKGTIRDFYPPAAWQGRGGHPYQYYIDSFADLPAEELDAMANAVGTPVTADKISTLIDFAFLTLHGPYGEDGAIQGLLEWYGIPYSGSGILPSAIGIDKLVQNGLMAEGGFARPKHIVLKRAAWLGSSNRIEVLQSVTTTLGLPLVIKAPRQGSSIGVTVLSAKDDALFAHAVNKAFFVEELPKQAWRGKSAEEKQVWLHQLIDIRSGLGLPIAVSAGPGGAISPSFLQKHQGGPILFYLADALAEFLDSGLYTGTLLLESPDGEDAIFFEEFIKGREFSCIVVRGEQGQAIALPPTEIIKKSDIFDYRAKYLPGISRKVTPIDLDEQRLELIKRRCKDLFEALRFNVYARIDGFITAGGEVFLNDPNTTSGMLPSSFFFHQAAEIGLNPSQFVTYIIRASLAERLQNGKRYIQNRKLLEGLDMQIANMQTAKSGKTRVAVIMGGYSVERHISVESGRNVFEKLASSGFYEVTPVFLTGSDEEHQLYKLPINVMLKDNADDIREKVLARDKTHLALERIREEAQELTLKYAGHAITKPVAITYLELSRVVDVVFIALHGRPGEDGAVQAQLERYGIPYNGSGQASSRTTINKYDTNELLARHGVLVAKHALISKLEFTAEPATAIGAIESQFSYPFIAKPCDDGCSAAVKKIKNRDELAAFAALIFRAGFALHEGHAYTLHLQANEEFPRKDVFMVEELISANGAARFLEITGGLYTSYDHADNLQYHVFEPSEALAGGEVLSLEEKFLAGEGQNITPARFSADPARQAQISAAVRMELEKVARIVGVEGYCRTDAFVRIYGDGRVETVIIEVNSLPGMTPATCIFHQAAIADMRPFDFIDAILSFGRKRALLPV